MSERAYTADEIESAIATAIRAVDAEGVMSLMVMLYQADSARAERMMAVLTLATDLAINDRPALEQLLASVGHPESGEAK